MQTSRPLLPQPCLNFINYKHKLTIAASVATGFEVICMSEINEKLPQSIGKSWISRGRVYFVANTEDLEIIHNLKTVDRLFLLIKRFDPYEYDNNKEQAINDLKSLVENVNWKEVEHFWHKNKKFYKDIPVSLCENLNGRKNIKCFSNQHELRYRVSGNRVGKSQSITSVDAEQQFGGALQDITKWKVDLTGYNLEIIINLGEKSVQLYLALTLQSLHRRNITEFGQTTLRATIAHCLLRSCDIKPFDIIIDPMCGTGAIPVEGSLEWCSYFIAGDMYRKPLLKTKANVKCNELNTIQLKVDIIQLDVTKLPFQNSCVDIVVSDMPFGKRVGSKVDNRTLYPKALKELARICNAKKGKDKKSMLKALKETEDVWKIKSFFIINIGGLRAGVFILQRNV